MLLLALLGLCAAVCQPWHWAMAIDVVLVGSNDSSTIVVPALPKILYERELDSNNSVELTNDDDDDDHWDDDDSEEVLAQTSLRSNRHDLPPDQYDGSFYATASTKHRHTSGPVFLDQSTTGAFFANGHDALGQLNAKAHAAISAMANDDDNEVSESSEHHWHNHDHNHNHDHDHNHNHDHDHDDQSGARRRQWWQDDDDDDNNGDTSEQSYTNSGLGASYRPGIENEMGGGGGPSSTQLGDRPGADMTGSPMSKGRQMTSFGDMMGFSRGGMKRGNSGNRRRRKGGSRRQGSARRGGQNARGGGGTTGQGGGGTTSNNAQGGGGARRATCRMRAMNKSGVYGQIMLEQSGPIMPLTLSGTMRNMRAGLHGFHVHQFGDMRRSCNKAGGHFNPGGSMHGAPTDAARHVGDLGNVVVGSNSRSRINVVDTVASLYGDQSIIGRALVMHASPDDLGRGGAPTSMTTGNAGARVSCCVIGWAND